MAGRHRHRETGTSVVVYADNYINDIEGEKLEEMCDAFLAKGFKKIVIDFSGTDLVNSIGVSILIGIIEKIKGKGAVVFSGLKDVNFQIFHIVGLTRHIRVFNNEEDALKGSASCDGASL
ncbi:MAG: hypothetical protein A2X93_08720 [Deltaproteobacteria bacterium GWC2_56_8]|nr:MAG: hypothetical protein A2X99_01230 [Deltaproteobacteria bacterium GWB2_55_19]OGP33316.1 MAG: hypothetical protein A2X93_08720 [Deltaproteobacteria bacterium GWC2_56_8]HAO93226.1 hypothetical protein [Deltaproteobacteria bacterium]